jgi:hypothetical protein
MVNLGSEEVSVRPKIIGAGEALVGLAPFHQVGGGVYVQTLPRNDLGAGAAAGTVKVIYAILGKNKGVTQMNLMQLHGRYLLSNSVVSQRKPMRRSLCIIIAQKSETVNYSSVDSR